MNARSKTISKLKDNAKARASYVRAKLDVNIPSQIRALRRRQGLTQAALAREAEMKQSRISAMERPGERRFNLETLIRLAATFKVGLIVRFASFSELLEWENDFSQDEFDVTRIEDDAQFLNPVANRQTTATVATSRYVYHGVPPAMSGWIKGVSVRLDDARSDRETIEEWPVYYFTGEKGGTPGATFFEGETLLQEQKPITEIIQ